jgi:anti-sigma B factor antagonist
MSAPPAKLSVLAGEKSACVRIVGRATLTSSLDFQTVLEELRQRGCARFVLDLAECALMDSTFLGVLAAFAVKLNAPAPGQPQLTLELLNPNPRVVELLETLGVIDLFKRTQGPLVLPEPAQTQSPAPLQPSPEQLTRTCLEAHQTLMALNPANVAKFKDVAQFFAENLKKQQS